LKLSLHESAYAYADPDTASSTVTLKFTDGDDSIFIALTTTEAVKLASAMQQAAQQLTKREFP
jgi:hypothetical protein